MPPPTCDNYKIKCTFWSRFDLTVTLTQNLMHLTLPQSVLVELWLNSASKYPRYRGNARTLWKHNASSHYVGGGIKNPQSSQTSDQNYS